MDVDSDILLQSSTAFLRSVIGEQNWQRWVFVREQSQQQSLHSFVAFLLDAAEQQIQPESFSIDASFEGYSEAVPQEVVDYQNAEAYSDSGATFATNSHRATSARGKRVRRKTPYTEPSSQDDVANNASTPGDGMKLEPAPTGPCLVYGDESKSETAFYCEACQIHVNKMEGAVMHLAKVHAAPPGGDPVPLRCRYCGVAYADPHAFLATHAPPRDCSWRLACPHCHKLLSSKYKLKVHIANVHGSAG